MEPDMSEHLYTTPTIDRSLGLRRHIMTTAMRSFGGWGYREIQVPLLHFFEALRPGLDEDQIERSFRFVDRGGNLMMLRPDVTPVIAQVFAVQYGHTALPLRVSYTHKVVRLERSFGQRELESYQLGAERIGGDALVGDLEILLLALEALERMGLWDCRLVLGDHAIADRLLKATGAPSRIRGELRDAILARDAFEVRALLTRLGTRPQHVKALLALTRLDAGIEPLDRLVEATDDREVRARVRHLRELHAALASLGYGERVDVQLSELGGASYYTGMGFSIVSPNVAQEVGRGGRYDDLVGRYGAPTPAVGFSMSLELLVEALRPRANAFEQEREHIEKVHVDPREVVSGFKRALELRAEGKTAHIDRLEEGP
jgi:ATP phosphoribosyltransferase regulatory subunit